MNRRAVRRDVTVAVVGLVASFTLAACSSGGSASIAPGGSQAIASKSAVDLSGVTLNFGDTQKEWQTAFDSTDAFKGIKYKVVFSDVEGPSVIPALEGGSVDLASTSETTALFAQAQGVPIKVVAALAGVNKQVPYSIMVAPNSGITSVAQLRGKTIALRTGTVTQWVLVRDLSAAGVPYKDVTIDNLALPAGNAALESGNVNAAVTIQPLISILEGIGKGRPLPNATGLKFLQFMVASNSALSHPATAAAIQDFLVRLARAQAIIGTHLQHTIDTFAATYGVSKAEASKAVRAADNGFTPISPSIIAYQQNEAIAFIKLGLLPHGLKVASEFDLPLNRKISHVQGPSS